MVRAPAWVTGQLTSIHRYLGDLLGSLGGIALFLSVEAAVTIIESRGRNSFAQDSESTDGNCQGLLNGFLNSYSTMEKPLLCFWS